MLNTILSVIFVIVCAALTGIVLMQEGKQRGLGSIGGIAESYWGKIKGRSVEGALEKEKAPAEAGAFFTRQGNMGGKP